MALLYGGSILSNAVSGLISAGIFSGLEGALGIRGGFNKGKTVTGPVFHCSSLTYHFSIPLLALSGWRWLFIIEGSITVFIALCAVFILPDFPHNSSMLTEEERKLAMHRLAIDAGQSEVEGSQGERPIDGIKQAIRDPIIWLFALCLTSCTIGVAFNQ